MSKQPRRFFTSKESKEINDWRVKLRTGSFDQRKDVIKRVIRAMTYGKEVSSLFQEMMVCCETPDIETKKLTYLYLMNYARLKADLAIRVINVFAKDSRDPNPIIRGLAIRSMSSLRVDKIVDHLVEPLQRAARDDDAYVRKTVAIAIAKLFELDPEVTIDKKFVSILNEMLSDSVPMVVANAVAALSEICSNSKVMDLTFKSRTIKILLEALKGCTEWGQVYILDALADYSPQNARETDNIIEKIIPLMQHANSAVVLSAIKVIIRMLDYEAQSYTEETLMRKMSGPLVTLLNNPPEIQYVALKNISLIVQRYPEVLSHQIKMFFCKFDDPIYVKLEKISIMVKLADNRNINQVLLELKDYSQAVDVQFVRKSVRAIGRCAIKIEQSAQSCVDVLVELIQTKIDYVVQEAVIVIKDIFRKYPNRYEMVIGILCQNLDTLDEPEAKAAMIWIIGEYADRIEQPDQLLEMFAETFFDEDTDVQLSVLTACVKLFLRVPNSETKALLGDVLGKTTEKAENPDVRDRAYIYWRMIHGNLSLAKKTVLSRKESISSHSDDIPANVLEKLLENISMLSSVYQKPPEMFVPKYEVDSDEEEEEEEEEEEKDDESEGEDEENEDYGQEAYGDSQQTNFEDILGMGNLDGGSGKSPKRKNFKLPLMLDGDGAGKGLSIFGRMGKSGQAIFYDFVFYNVGNEEMSTFACKFKQNSWGLGPQSIMVTQCGTLKPNQHKAFKLPLSLGKDQYLRKDSLVTLDVNVAIKFNNQTIVFFQDEMPFRYLFMKQTETIRQEELMLIWQTSPNERQFTLKPQQRLTAAKVGELFQRRMILRATSERDRQRFIIKINVKNLALNILFEVVYKGNGDLGIVAKSPEGSLLPLLEKELGSILKAQVIQKQKSSDFF